MGRLSTGETIWLAKGLTTPIIQTVLLLRDHHRCPSCFTLNVRRDVRRCVNDKCGVPLIFPGDTAKHLTEQLIKHFYVWTRDQGWIYASHFENPQPYIV